MHTLSLRLNLNTVRLQCSNILATYLLLYFPIILTKEGFYNCKNIIKSSIEVTVLECTYMPLQLDDYDVSILRSLLKDGRKSFREISRETGITTPTVKARFTRLVNVGFIKSVSPIFDLSIVKKNENILRPDYDKQQEEQRQQNESIKDSAFSLT